MFDSPAKIVIFFESAKRFCTFLHFYYHLRTNTGPWGGSYRSRGLRAHGRSPDVVPCVRVCARASRARRALCARASSALRETVFRAHGAVPVGVRCRRHRCRYRTRFSVGFASCVCALPKKLFLLLLFKNVCRCLCRCLCRGLCRCLCRGMPANALQQGISLCR